ncbi:toxin glutamine deamidase domain-containing protein [Agromyces sp. H66]|uniref:toxin glutamine deamidase domain-containing protein n=1 Tax=Agromyces sp. H66 TaxID=2529859 RepID=UPI00145A709B|nr:toxin glutamine deamidase domain-containing protein [Agromyces sp. H66]
MAAVAGAAALLTNPAVPGAKTPAGSTSDASASPQAATPDGSTPGSATPGGTPDGTSQSGTDNGTTDGDKSDKPDKPENNHTERTIDEIDQALGEINPNYDPSDPQNGYATNCGNTSSILNDFLNGQPTSEAPTGTLDVPEMEARTGNPQTPMTPAQIDASLRAMGPGSHCVVGIDRSTGDGHWFNAYFDGTTVWSVDAQTGSRTPWPPNEPHATNWDASIRPEHVVDSDGATPDVTNAPPSAGSTGVAHQAAAHEASTPDDGRSANAKFEGKATVSPDHASDGSQGPGTTYNGYAIPELTPEIRRQLDELAARSDSPIVRNEDGSYSLKEPISVDAFDMSNPEHDWDEFQRQVGLQQQGLNKLTIAEWRHNVDFYEQQNRVAKSEQAAGNHALAVAGVQMKGQAVLHGPDQVAGGRADRYDGAGSLRVNSSLGSQWQHRVDDLRLDIADAMATIDPKLRPHVMLNVHLGATNSVDGSPAATQSTLTSATRVTSAPAAPPARTSAIDPSVAGTSRDTAADAPEVTTSPNGTAAPDGTDGSESSTEGTPESPDSESAPEGSEPEGAEPEGTDTAAADAVPSTIHHPLLDEAFPHLPTAETHGASVATVNALGWDVDVQRFQRNCHYVVNALELRFRGYNVVASPTVLSEAMNPQTGAVELRGEGRYPLSIAADWVQADGSRRDFESLGDFDGDSPMQALQELTASWPVGGRGFISGTWKKGGGVGHIFTVVKEADGIKLYDGQSSNPDVADYLDGMHFRDSDGAGPGMIVLRVDDLAPTPEVLNSAKPWTWDEHNLMQAWRDNPEYADKPKEMIDREIEANRRWRKRNRELIDELTKIIDDPDANLADRKRAWDDRIALQEQSNHLKRGADRLQEALDTATSGSKPATTPEGTESEASPEASDPESTPEGSDPEGFDPAVTPEATEPESKPEVTPEGSVPESAPEVTPEGSVPESAPEVTPEGAHPEATPEGSVPESAPEGADPEATPEGSVPGSAPEVTPEGADPEAPPEGSVPGSAPEGAVPESAPEGTPEGAVPESAPEVTPEGADPEATPEGSVPESAPEVTPEGSVPESAPEVTPESTHPESPPDATPEGTGAGAADPVPSTIHHPLLDAAFLHLQAAETRAVSIATVNAMGWNVDVQRFRNNCHYVVNALELRFRGYDVIASPTVQSEAVNPQTGAAELRGEGRYPVSIAADWVQADGSRRDFDNLSDFDGDSPMQALQQLTASWPVGGRGFISGNWKKGGGGHIFTVVKEADGIRLHDGQTGQADVTHYLDAMFFNQRSEAPWKDIIVLRVDDLVPTSEVLKTSTSWTWDEHNLMQAWKDNPEYADKPKEMIDREIEANRRWRERNAELIAELDDVLNDPDTSVAEKQRAWDDRYVLHEQNVRLEAGASRLREALGTVSPKRLPLYRELTPTPPEEPSEPEPGPLPAPEIFLWPEASAPPEQPEPAHPDATQQATNTTSPGSTGA